MSTLAIALGVACFWAAAFVGVCGLWARHRDAVKRRKATYDPDLEGIG